jgi:hypothetical protein
MGIAASEMRKFRAALSVNHVEAPSVATRKVIRARIQERA